MRLARAGIEAIEARISHLAHAPEIAVGMAEMALAEERKAAMAGNLLIVLCSERGVEPMVNTGTLYQ